jgi:hypothetical protein
MDICNLITDGRNGSINSGYFSELVLWIEDYEYEGSP